MKGRFERPMRTDTGVGLTQEPSGGNNVFGGEYTHP